MYNQEPFQNSGARRGGMKKYGLLLAVGAIALVAAGILHRTHATSELKTIAADAAVPTVTLIAPQVTKDAGTLVLPGNLEPLNSAAIYAQTSGYIKEWSADIGDNVEQGQQLALLDAPELEHQLAQARADYRTAASEEKLAQSTWKRVQSMAGSGAVSKQAMDEASSNASARSAATSSALANVQRLESLQGFTKLTAPFAGVVTSRSAQVGDLVVSGVSGAQPLFTVSDMRRVRIYVRVPQNYIGEIHQGLSAELSLPEYPGRKFAAEVTRSARSVDMESGSMLVELQADNAEGALMPGAFTRVSFNLGETGESLRLPGSAVLYRDDGPAVAILDPENKVALKPITIGRDEGKLVEISSGVSAEDRVIDTPPDAIRSGDRVKIHEAVQAKASSDTAK